MRKSFGFVVGVAALVGTWTAQAGNLTSATLQFTLGTFPPASFSVTGLVGAGTAMGSGVTAYWKVGDDVLPSGVFTTTVPTSAAPPITKVRIVIKGNRGACLIAGTAGGNCLVTGVANIQGLGGMTLLQVPVTIGTPVTVIPPPAGGIAITAFGNAWTTKTTAIHSNTPPPGVPATFSPTRMGSNGLVGGAGTVVLVTALNVLNSAAGQWPSFAVLTLNYQGAVVTEPGTLLLVGSGIAGLVAMGRSKMRK